MKKSLGALNLSYSMPVWLVGTFGTDGKPNAMTVAAGMSCCRKPPCIAMALREATYTYQNLKERPYFTVSIPSVVHAVEADYFGIVSGKNEDKFKATGLTPVSGDFAAAPYIDECPVVLECKLIDSKNLGSHTLCIGEVLDVKADEAVLGENGFPLLERIRPFVYDGGNLVYHELGPYLGKAFSMGKKLKE